MCACLRPSLAYDIFGRGVHPQAILLFRYRNIKYTDECVQARNQMPEQPRHYRSPPKSPVLKTSKSAGYESRSDIPPQVRRNRQIGHARLGATPLAELPKLEHIGQNLGDGHVEAIRDFVAYIAVVIHSPG